MRTSNQKNPRTNDLLPFTIKSLRRIPIAPRKSLLLFAYLGLSALLTASFGCAPASSQGDGKQSDTASSTSNDLPEITEETVRERINGVRVREVPEETQAAEPIIWNFDEDEPKEIRVVEKQMEGTRATLLLDITTRSASDVRNPRHLAGRIRTEWQLKTGWVLRKWEIVKAENVSLKYKNLPNPPAQNSNR